MQNYSPYFIGSSTESLQVFEESMQVIIKNITSQFSQQHQPYSGLSPEELLEEIQQVNFFPQEGLPMEEVIERTKALTLAHNSATFHPLCMAHLHSPVFIGSLIAEVIIAAFNQSMDSWDQGPAAAAIEQTFCNQLCHLFGYNTNADAVFTSGGTMSNFMALLLARDAFCADKYQWNIQQQGLPPQYHTFRILCPEHAHFSVEQSASYLGLGTQSVIRIPSNNFEEEVEALEATIHSLRTQGLNPIAYVSTAGTTDYGACGNIEALASCTNKHKLWLHVDAAYGGALIFSEQHKHKLKGIENADSVTVDFHKLFFQNISCGVFMVKDKSSFDHIRLHADYLNPEGNEDIGLLDLVYKSIQTTRRFDALKPYLSLQHVGVKKLGEMIDYTIALADSVSSIIEQDSLFVLATKPQINAIVFRYIPNEDLDESEIDYINDKIKTRLLLSGKAIIGQTKLNGKSYLKFTLLNPMNTEGIVQDLLEEIKRIGSEILGEVAISLS